MLLKTIGLVTVFLACCMAGEILAQKERKKSAFCADVCELLACLRDGIASSRLPVGEILCTDERLKPTLFSGCADRYALLLRLRALQKTCGEDELCERSLRFLEQLGKSGDYRSETARCEELLAFARRQRDLAQEAVEKKATLYGKLGAIAGAAVCVLLA